MTATEYSAEGAAPTASESSGGVTIAEADEILRKIRDGKKVPSEDMSQRDQDLKKNRELRERFMNWMLAILISQLAVVNVAILALTWFDKIKLEEWTLRVWIAGTLLEVFGIVLVIANYLFPSGKRREGKQR